MMLSIIIWIVAIIFIVGGITIIVYDVQESKEGLGLTGIFMTGIGIIIIFISILTLSLDKEDNQKLFVEYEVVEKFTTIKNNDVLYYVELRYVDNYELVNEKDFIIIKELYRYSDYERYKVGNKIKLEVKVKGVKKDD